MKPAPGEVLLLENLRFHPEEEKNDPGFSKKLAALCDVYVNDAFGSAHRAHASTEGMIAFVPKAAAGLLMEQELKYLGMATTNPARPCIAILGGAKVSDKIEVIENLGKIVDQLLIGGAMAYTFLKAQGQPTGKSLVEDDKVDLARDLLAKFGAKLMLPVDHVVVSEMKEGAPNEVVETIPDGKIGVDIGPEDHRRILESDRRRQDRDLERPDGHLREAAVRQGHGGAGARPWRNPARFRWWAAAIRKRPSKPPGSPTRSRTSPRAAARRSSSWRASNCRAWPRSRTSSRPAVINCSP